MSIFGHSGGKVLLGDRDPHTPYKETRGWRLSLYNLSNVGQSVVIGSLPAMVRESRHLSYIGHTCLRCLRMPVPVLDKYLIPRGIPASLHGVLQACPGGRNNDVPY